MLDSRQANHYLSDKPIMELSTDATIYEMGRIELTCKVDPVLKVNTDLKTWTASVLLNGEDSGIPQDSGSLDGRSFVVKEASPAKHSGKYSCAINYNFESMGSVKMTSDSQEIRVLGTI